MHPVLERIERGLRGAAGHLTEAQLASGPPGKWTTAQIVEHLGRAFSGTAVGARRAIAAGRPLATRRSLRSRAAVLLVVEAGYLPPGRRSPKVAEPIGADPVSVVLEQTLTHLQAMDDALAHAERRFGPSVQLLDHPVLGPLTARQWRRFHWVHTRHHLKQIAERSRR